MIVVLVVVVMVVDGVAPVVMSSEMATYKAVMVGVVGDGMVL